GLVHPQLGCKQRHVPAAFGLGQHDAHGPRRHHRHQIVVGQACGKAIDAYIDRGRGVPFGKERGGKSACLGLALRSYRVLQVEDESVRARLTRSIELPFRIGGHEEQRAHQAFSPSGLFMIIACRRQRATSTSFWLKARCSNSTMPRSGFERDSRTLLTSVSTRSVSPWKSGWGKMVSFIPRLAIVVLKVVSWTEMPIIRPRVKRELTSGRPHSVFSAKSKSI